MKTSINSTVNTAQRLIVFNRAGLQPADGWIHVVPKGELPNREAGLVQVLDDAALDSILANIEADKNRLGAKWPGVYAGREHFIYDGAQDSAALGWFSEFQKRADGIWASAEGLTTLGAEAVKNRLYKYTSFVADPSDLEQVGGEPSSGASSSAPLPRYRVKKIETIGFTNFANGKEMLTPIANRNFSGAGIPPDRFDDTPRRDAYATNKTHRQDACATTKGPQMKSVCTLLGLSADADESSVHAAVNKLLNRADIAPDALAALRAEHQSLGEQNQLLLNEQAEALLDGCGVKEERVRNRLKDGMKLLKNRQERTNYLADFGYAPGKAGGRETSTATRALNRGSGAAREAIAVSSTLAGNHNEQALAIKILNRASELQSQGLKYDPAWNQARREVLGRN